MLLAVSSGPHVALKNQCTVAAHGICACLVSVSRVFCVGREYSQVSTLLMREERMELQVSRLLQSSQGDVYSRPPLKAELAVLTAIL